MWDNNHINQRKAIMADVVKYTMEELVEAILGEDQRFIDAFAAAVLSRTADIASDMWCDDRTQPIPTSPEILKRAASDMSDAGGRFNQLVCSKIAAATVEYRPQLLSRLVIK